ncbi:MAG TPA: NAD(P)-dependent oxidoreductase, partial [Opitutales bacterium]|nr:NAD(P)-dependent oxidoreductase [Opitutales bacterium]
AKAAATPREAAKGAGVILSMLADDHAARAVWLGEDGALAGAKKGAVLVECSTITPEWVKELGEAAEKKGCKLLDAPVTGTKPHAAAGELTFLVGGDAAAIEKARPALAVMSKAIVHVGPSGSGALIKLLNNFLCAVQAAAFAEALVVIENAGLDRAKALDLLTNGTPGSPLVKAMAARMTARDYTPQFSMKLMAKDLVYAGQTGWKHGVDLATAARALEIFQKAIAEGHGEEDFSSVVELLRKK